MIVPGRAHHCGKLARSLRVGHRHLLEARAIGIHRFLRQTLDMSSWTRAWVEDGRVLALAGLTGTTASPEGMIWLAISEEAEKQPIRLARMVLSEVEKLLQTKRRLTAFVLKDDRAAIRFAYFLGFTVERAEVVNGIEGKIMSCTREVI